MDVNPENLNQFINLAQNLRFQLYSIVLVPDNKFYLQIDGVITVYPFANPSNQNDNAKT